MESGAQEKARLGKQCALGYATQKPPLGMKHSFPQLPGLLPAGGPWPDSSPRITLYQRKLPCPRVYTCCVHPMTRWCGVKKACPLCLNSGHLWKAMPALEFSRVGWCPCCIYIANPASFIPLPRWFLEHPPPYTTCMQISGSESPRQLDPRLSGTWGSESSRWTTLSRSLSVMRKEDSCREVLSKEDGFAFCFLFFF